MKKCSFLSTALAYLLLLNLLYGCTKSTIGNEKKMPSSASEQGLELAFFNKNGEQINITRSSKRSVNNPGCSDYAYLTHFSTPSQEVVALPTTNDSVRVIVHWLIKTPSDYFTPVFNTFTRAYYRLKKNGVATSWKNKPLEHFTYGFVNANYMDASFNNWFYLGIPNPNAGVLGTPSYTTVNDNGQTFNMINLQLSYSFTLSAEEYCYYDGGDQYIRIGTDCDEIPYIQMIGFTNLSLSAKGVTANAYRHSPIAASLPGSIVLEPSGEADIYPSYPYTCHLGSNNVGASIYTIKYRLKGTTDWSYHSAIINPNSSNLYNRLLTVPSTQYPTSNLSPGTYEVQTCGLIEDLIWGHGVWSSVSDCIVY